MSKLGILAAVAALALVLPASAAATTRAKCEATERRLPTFPINVVGTSDYYFSMCRGRRLSERTLRRPCRGAPPARLVARGTRGHRLRFRVTRIEGDVEFYTAGRGYRYIANTYPPRASITSTGRFFFLSVYC